MNAGYRDDHDGAQHGRSAQLLPARRRLLPRLFEAPDRPFEFKEQHDFDLHIALEVDRPMLLRMLEKGRAEGREVRGIADHGFIHSIYFRDPNGYVIELTAKTEEHDHAMDPERNRARRILDSWSERTNPGAAG